MIYQALSEVDFSLNDLPPIPHPQRVVLTTPAYFDVHYVINPHMQGHIGTVDPGLAMQQWQALLQAYETLHIEPRIMRGQEGFPDMVFCANQTLPYLALDGSRGVVLSRMHSIQRAEEVAPFAAFFAQEGYAIATLPERKEVVFEGMGDAIWHPERHLLWGGYGQRTTLASYTPLSNLLKAPILALPLSDPDFYHLDTCFCVLDRNTVLIYPGAFKPQSLALIRHFFDQILEAPEEEARQNFACNAHCPDGTHVLIQRGSTVTNRLLRDAGFTPVELDTREFLKAGGSVFCMKQMIW